MNFSKDDHQWQSTLAGKRHVSTRRRALLLTTGLCQQKYAYIFDVATHNGGGTLE